MLEVEVRHIPMLGEALIGLGTEVEGAIWAPGSALQPTEAVNVLDLGEVLVRLRLFFRLH